MMMMMTMTSMHTSWARRRTAFRYQRWCIIIGVVAALLLIVDGGRGAELKTRSSGGCSVAWGLYEKGMRKNASTGMEIYAQARRILSLGRMLG